VLLDRGVRRLFFRAVFGVRDFERTPTGFSKRACRLEGFTLQRILLLCRAAIHTRGARDCSAADRYRRPPVPYQRGTPPVRTDLDASLAGMRNTFRSGSAFLFAANRQECAQVNRPRIWTALAWLICEIEETNSSCGTSAVNVSFL